jgi:hypothetical protein
MHSLTSAVAGDEWSASRLGRFIPGKEPQKRYGRGGEEDNSQRLTGLKPPIIQSIA